ncbi:uncharacterized protein LOC143277553 [Babylonia areolata]|uniref:uncharacterized protein LOC143277553 n=1 Tax=Babylonia areolata TaxID=304850 RepID=UPI003FD4F955
MVKTLCLAIALLASFFYIEGLKLEGDQLRAGQEPVAFWDKASKQWLIRLTCGSFTFQGHPPLNVTWTTPRGEARFSSGYDHDSGRFYLNLDTPLQGGNYTCSVPPHHLPLICDEDEAKPDNGSVSVDVSVDEMEGRLILAEASQKTLQTMLENLEEKHRQDIANLTQQCQGIKETLEQRQVILQKLQKSLEKCEIPQESQESQEPEEPEEPEEYHLTGPCKSGEYKTLNDSWRSASNNVGEYSDDYRCDSKLEAWLVPFLPAREKRCHPDIVCGGSPLSDTRPTVGGP